jgi:hypothetical protein
MVGLVLVDLPAITFCAVRSASRASTRLDVSRVGDEVPSVADDADVTDVTDRAVLSATTRAATERRMEFSP